MNNPTIAAGIVIFNPDNKERLINCIETASRQAARVYIFDNSTLEVKIQFPNNVTYITEGENKGIAYALNRIMEYAEADGFSWVVALDQDSLLPDGMVADFIKYAEQEGKIGIICPQVIDKRRPYMQADDSDEIEFLDMCITSASCTSVSAWRTVGKYDEWLFIDLVDNEFCKRLVASGYKILQVKKWVLDQEFGKIIPKSKKQQEFWIKVSKVLRNQNFAKFSYKKWVSPQRVYYTCRNIIYVNKKMKLYGKTAYANYNCNGYFGFLLCFVLPSILRAKHKCLVIRSTINGIKAGLKVQVQPWKNSDSQ